MLNGFYGWNLPNFSPQVNGKNNAKYLNSMQCMDVFNRLANIALSRFKWSGLPSTCYAERLEQTLFFYGNALFFDDENLGFVHTPVNLPGPFNIYYESVNREAYSFHFQAHRTINNSVLIKANKSMFPDYITVWNYTPKIANVMRAIDVHCETLKRPFIIACQEKEISSVKRAINNISDNEPAIVGEKFVGDNGLKVLSLGTTSNLQEMWATVKNYFNQCFNSLGIKNNYTEKKERMITTEAEGEGNSTRHMLEAELDSRRYACEEINRMFGLNVSVEANELETFTDELLEIEAARITGGLQNMEEESEADE